MRSEEYEYLDQLEDQMWWFSGLRGNVEELLSGRVKRGGGLLDAGCGTGGMLSVLEKKFSEVELHGIDYSEDACVRSRQKSSATIQYGSVTSLPYEDNYFDIITSLDVLEYDSVDVDAALSEFRRCLKKNGVLILNLPAYQWMVSYHDIAVGQVKRFTLGRLKHELTSNGFRVVYGTYWNTLFFPLMVLRRKIFVRRDGASDVKQFSPAIEDIFLSAMHIERSAIKRSWRLPFGGSVLVLSECTG